MSQSRFALILLSQYGQGWLVGGAVLLITSIFFGIFLDYRILVGAIIVICLVVPAMIMILYYNYGLKGYNYLNVNDHRIYVENQNLKVALRLPSLKEEEGVDEEKPEQSEEKKEEREEEWREYIFPLELLGKYITGKDYVVFPFADSHKGFIYLPTAAYKEEKDFLNAVEIISKRGRNENNQG